MLALLGCSFWRTLYPNFECKKRAVYEGVDELGTDSEFARSIVDP
jgi:hypothetical protein